MKLRNLLFIGLASAAILAGCKRDEIQESPSLKVDSSALEAFSAKGGDSEVQTITVTSNREWKATYSEEWVHVEPASGAASADAQTVSIYVDENTDMQRSAEIVFTTGVVKETVTVSQLGIDIEYTSIADLRKQASGTDMVAIQGAIYVKGVVVSNPDLNNLTSKKSVYIQDETAGIQLYFAENVTYKRGDEIAVNAAGLKLSFYGNAMQIVTDVTEGSDGKSTTVGVPLSAATLLSSGNEITAKEITMEDLRSFTYESMYVSIKEPVQVVDSDLEKTFVVGNSHTSIIMTDADNNKFEVRSSSYSTFGSEKVPQGSGVIKGIASRYYETPQLIFSTSEDWTALTGERFDIDIPDPEPENAVYYNNFDKEAAATDSPFPFLDETEAWKNETGSGASAVEYSFSGVSLRNNSNSEGKYSDYAGSGVNNLFFGTDAYFQISKIALTAQNYTLSFGTERYEYGVSDNTFNPEEFHVYISDNGERWVELEYAFPNGFKNGRWDLASTTFTVPAGTGSLYVYFSSDLKSSHRLDDVALAESAEAGTSIDFSKGTEIGGGETPDPSEKITISEVVASADDTPVVTSGQVMAKSTNGFVLSDETGNIFVYGASVVGQVEIGSYATVSGKKDTFNNQAQIGSPAVSDVKSGTASYPEPQQLNGNESAIVSGLVSYVTWSGILGEASGSNYYNFDIEGAERQGSLYYSDPSLDLASKVGLPVVVEGYYTSHSTKYLYVIPVSVTVDEGASYLNISKTSQSVTAEAGSFTFDVTSNASWTAESSDADFTVSPASGDGDATVTVNYTENTASESRTATITVKAGDITRTLTVTQAAPVSGDALTIVLDAATRPSDDFPDTSAGETGTKSYNIGGYDWTFSASDGAKFSWYSNGGYILFGKEGAYVLMPSVPGKHLSKVTMITGSGASTSVSAGIYTEDGSAPVSGGESIVLNAQNAEFSWTLSGTEDGARYQLRVTNSKNAQFKKLTLLYE